MKRKMKQLLCLMLVLALSLIAPTPTTSRAAKKKKVKLNKSKITLTVGKTAKLKVKNTKKKVKWSSSKKSVATVSKKGKIRAKKAGKTTITAKVGKKKLTCKVTVKAKKSSATKAPTPTKTPVSTPSTDTPVVTPTKAPILVSSVTIENQQQIQVILGSKQKLTKKNFTVKLKKNAGGTFQRELKISHVLSTDNTRYSIMLKEDSYLTIGDYVEVTISDLMGTNIYAKELFYDKTNDYTTNEVYHYGITDNLEKTIQLDGMGYFSIEKVELPEGLQYTAKVDVFGDTTITITGTPTQTGVYEKKIVYKDELGSTYTKNIVWLISSEDTLVAWCAPHYGTFKSGDYRITNNKFYVYGGSGQYNYELSDNDLLLSKNDKWINKTFTEAGNYEISFGVTDANNPELKTNFVWKVSLPQASQISVKLLDAEGNIIENMPRDVTLINQDEGTLYGLEYRHFERTADTLYLWGIDGTYDIYIEMYGFAMYYNDYKMQGKNAKLNITLPLYPVVTGPFNYALSNVSWKNKDNELCGTGNKLYLTEGFHQLQGSTQTGFVKHLLQFICDVTPGENNVASITKTDKSAIVGTLTAETPAQITVEYIETKYITFVAPETATYQFTASGARNMNAQIRDENNNVVMNQTGGVSTTELTFRQELEAGKTYQVGVGLVYSNDAGKNVTLSVQKEE